MIDLHAHILPGLDDGARTLADSRELARTAVEDGVRSIAATPHVRADYPTSVEAMEAGVASVRRDLEEHGIEIEVLHGGEIAVDRLEDLSREELERFTLGQTGRYLLVEFPYTSWPLGLEQRLFELRMAGLESILAHPERNREVQADPARIEPLVAAGTLVQLTAASLDGRIGRSSQMAAESLLSRGLAHLIASDAHLPEIREVGMAAAAACIRDQGLARWLVEDAPAAIAAGDPVPARPKRRKRRFGL
ncbi:MAG TPA: CpsB/CapC family capsule biosynthesis tyrosine phosphatase [Gaiellaceae bacterium]|nr:CpsB/CapC family capsule biosynthesis tyrosine phosphatase [Gaiellaceae bacterium]